MRGLVVLGVVLFATPTQAAKSTTLPRLPPRPTVAVFPLVLKGAVRAETIGEVELAMGRAINRVGSEQRVQVLFGQALSATFKKKDPRALVERCHGETKCYADLGRKVRAELVVIGRLDARGELALLAIKNGTQSSSATITLDRAGHNEATLAAQLADFFGLPRPQPPAPAPPPPASLPASRPVAATVAVVPLVPQAVAHFERRPNRLLFGVGIALFVAGAGGLAAGTVFGIQSYSLRTSIKTSTPQIEAFNTNVNANTQAVRADILLGVGGGVALLGATLFALSYKYAVNVSVQPGLAYANLGVPW